MRKMFLKIKHVVEYIVVILLGASVRLLPYRLALGIGSMLGRMVWLLGVRRDVTAANIRIALGRDISSEEIVAIGKESYEEMGRSMIDFLRMPVFAGGRWKEYMELEGGEHLDAAIAGGTGAVILSGHFGSSELITTVIAGSDYPVSLVIGTQKNPFVDEVCKKMRRSSGADIIEEQDVARGAIRALRSGRCVGFLADQDAGRDGSFVDFFGIPASTPAGAAAFAVRTGAAIIVSSIVRNGTHQKVVLSPPKYFGRSGDKEKDLAGPTQYFTSVLEERVRENPGRYFWMHKRWKTRPWGRVKEYTYETITGSN
jgi:KDO2-lipid IV(A) lauroyltransferase